MDRLPAVSSESEGGEETNSGVMSAFVAAYESLPVLWDPGNENYLNKQQRCDGIRVLLDIYRKIVPQATTNDVKLKLNSLRANYRKELKKVQTSRRLGCSEADCYKPTSWYYYALEFLRKLEAPQDEKTPQIFTVQRTTAKAAVATPSPQDETPPQKCTLKRAAAVTLPTPPLLPSNSGSSEANIKSKPQPPPSKKPREMDLIERQNELLQQLATHLERTHRRQPPQDPAPVLPTIARVWGEQLGTLDPQQRIFAEKAINDILFEASLGTLNRYSIQININETTDDIDDIDDTRYLENDDDDPIIHDPMHTH